MSSLAWTTIVAAILLAPGFLFFLGLYSPKRFSRDAAPASPLVQLGALVIISFFVHLVLYILINKILCHVKFVPSVDLVYVFAFLQMNGAKEIPLSVLNTNISQNIWWISLYFISSIGLGYFIGWFIGDIIILKLGKLSGSILHKWALDVIGKTENDFVLAYVLTRICHNEKILMYKGFLKEIYLNKEGNISYLVLTGSAKNYMNMGEPAPTATDTNSWHVIGDENEPDDSVKELSNLVIDGADIANVIFDKFSLQESADDKNRKFQFFIQIGSFSIGKQS